MGGQRWAGGVQCSAGQGSSQLAQSHGKFKPIVWISQQRSRIPTPGGRLLGQRDGCAFPRQSTAPWLPSCCEGPLWAEPPGPQVALGGPGGGRVSWNVIYIPALCKALYLFAWSCG